MSKARDADARRLSAQDAVLLAALEHVPFDGWTEKALRAGARSAGMAEIDARRLFAGGMPEAARHAADYFDRRMLERLAELDLDSMRIRDRVAAGVRVRLEEMAPYREAIKRLVAYMALPGMGPLAARLAWQSCSEIWYAAGDDSADFNHYSKRGLLFAVYGTTTLCWLADESDDFVDTWAFLERRIDDVMKIPRYQARARAAVERLPNPLRLMRARRA